jgi:hypothetical protein
MLCESGAQLNGSRFRAGKVFLVGGTMQQAGLFACQSGSSVDSTMSLSDSPPMIKAGNWSCCDQGGVRSG